MGKIPTFAHITHSDAPTNNADSKIACKLFLLPAEILLMSVDLGCTLFAAANAVEGCVGSRGEPVIAADPFGGGVGPPKTPDG